MKQLILYYQTFISLKPLFDNNILPTHIHVSSIHFGKNENNIPYIHLNDEYKRQYKKIKKTIFNW